jgi:cytochrome c5
MRLGIRRPHHSLHLIIVIIGIFLMSLGTATVLFSIGGFLSLPGMKAAAQAGGPTPMAVPTKDPMGKTQIILPEMPADATQADYGAEVYRLVCSACHGDRGQGLTADWIATWDPSDQNCWKSKCHAANHPQDGFELPHYVPPVAGAQFFARFNTALDLYNYISQTMPWQDPGYMTADQFWQATAFLLRLNGIDPGKQMLNAQNAAGFVISRPAVQTISGVNTPTPTHTPITFEAGSGLPPDWLVLLIIILIVGGTGSGLWRRSRAINR